MTVSRRARVALAVLAVGAGSCGKETRTMLVVEVGSDLTVPAELDAVEVRVARTGVERQKVIVGLPEHELPARVGFVATEAVAGIAFEVTATGLRQGNPVVAEVAVLQFTEGRSQLVRLFLARACRGVTCAADETCTRGVTPCRPRQRVPAELEPFDPVAPKGDGAAAGPDGGDAGSARDVAIDVAVPPPEAGAGSDARDAVVAADAPADAEMARPDAAGGTGGAGSTPDAGPDTGAGGAPNLSVGLVGHRKLDDGAGMVARDESPAMNHGLLGTASFTPTWTAQGAWAGSGALLFDGADDLVNLGVSMLPAIGGRVTISLWVRWSEAVIDPSRRSFVTMLSMPANTGLHMGFREQRLAVWSYQNDQVVAAMPPAPGWHHLAYTFDGTVHVLYLDGVEVDRGPSPPQSGTTTALRIGASNSVGSQAFKGSIDDVRVWGRALTAAEVLAVRAAL